MNLFSPLLLSILFAAPLVDAIRYYKNEAHSSPYVKDLSERSGENNLLRTFSLSFVGNFDFSRTYEGIRKIFLGIAEFLDLKLIRSGVDFLFNTVLYSSKYGENSVYSVVDRIDSEDEALRVGVTYFIGALLKKQECWSKCICFLGDYSQNLSIKDVVILVAKRMVPEEWNSTLHTFVTSAEDKQDCQEFLCSPEVEE